MKISSKKINITIISAVAVLLIVVFVCVILGRDKNTAKKICELYFLNDSQTTLICEEREIKYHNTHDLKENVVNQLIKGPEEARNKAVINKGTELIEITEDDSGNVVVNFSEEFQTSDKTKNALSIYAVVKSLCALEGVVSVKVVVLGNDLQNDNQTAIGYLEATDINLPTDTHTSETKQITLYFPNRETGMLNREERTVKVTDQQPVAQYIINELIAGTKCENFNQSLNKSTMLLSVDTYGDLCFVNFKSDFLDKNSGSEEKEKLAVYSIVNSLTELSNIKRVQFLMDGKRVESFGEMDISKPFGRNSSAIE